MREFKYENKDYNFKNLDKDSIDRHTLGFIEKNKKVLELGCATGFHSKILKEEKNCQVFGVEIDQRAAKKSEDFTAKTITGNLEDKKTWEKIKENAPFDVVLASNILEHLSDTEKMLSLIKEVLKKDGYLVVAVPNIAFWRSRLRLLSGIWRYEDYGIFDRTHLRFFSLFSFRETLNRSGFSIIEEKYDPAGGAKFFTRILKKFPNAYAHQIAFKAKA